MIKILIVDDNVSFRRTFVEHLLQQFPGFRIAEASDVDEALEKVTDFDPHLLFVDIQLPAESGLDLTRKIRAGQSQVVIAILTGHDLPEYQEAARRLGADHFFSKSGSMDQVVALIESFE